MAINLLQENRQARLYNSSGTESDAVLTRFTAIEQMSEPFTIVADVILPEGAAALEDSLGKEFHIAVEAGPGRSRKFHGLLWQIAELESDTAGSHYQLTLKPWVSMYDIGQDCRVIQNKKVDDIVKQVVSMTYRTVPHKLRFDIESYPVLEYCVLYQESDFAFISRILERHGIYYYFTHASDGHEMVATDQKNHHTASPGVTNAIEVLPYTEGTGRPGGAIWSFSRKFEVAPMCGFVSDFDFLTPEKDMFIATNANNLKLKDDQTARIYRYPGGFTKATGDGRGEQISKRIAEEAQAETLCITAEGDVFAARVGSTIEIKAGPRAPAIKYLIIATTHIYAGSTYRGGSGEDDELTVQMQLIPASVQYRPKLKTPRPRIYGPQTAIVVGSAGEEIETDKYGRIKVRFPWSFEGYQDDLWTSCWIRVAQSMAGAKWGGFVLPRIGQEVVVEFLNGDPDTPLVTGAVYNGKNEPPYALPANKTRTTFKSRSSPKSQGFNELRFEDKAGSEEVFFHAEKDLNSVIDKGNETRTLNSGNRTTTISSGDETLEITKGKRTQTIQGDETLTIKSGNRKEEISQGNDELAIKMGNRSATIDMGNDSVTIKMGNQTIKLNLGKHTTDAMQGIDLICGGSSIKMTPASIEIKSMSVKIEGSIAFETKGLIMKQEASALHIVKGALVLIN